MGHGAAFTMPVFDLGGRGSLPIMFAKRAADSEPATGFATSASYPSGQRETLRRRTAYQGPNAPRKARRTGGLVWAGKRTALLPSNCHDAPAIRRARLE